MPVPAALDELAGGRALRPVWVNDLGGITFELADGSGLRFVKWAPAGSVLDLAAEAARLRWAAAFGPVPEVLEEGADATGGWLVTAALPGESAVTARWRADPERAVRGIGTGLRMLHDALPVAACPFSWSAGYRAARLRDLAAAGRLEPATWDVEHRGLGVGRALELAAEPPAPDRLVVCHGDACAPNTLLDDDGRCTGHVDLGTLGVADRWADLAVAAWSTEWNYGPGWGPALLAAYGVEPDPRRVGYYRLLWDLEPW